MGTPPTDYDGVILEDINDQLKFIIEALKAFRNVPADLAAIKDRMYKFDDWSEVAKLVITDQSKTLNQHDKRISRLETA